MIQKILFSYFLLFSSLSLAKSEKFEEWYTKLSDKQKIASLFVVGVKGHTLTPFEKRTFKKWPVGGVLYFKRNIKSYEQLKKLGSQIKQLIHPSPFTFVDQEGGDVVRIGTQYDTPAPLAIGSLKKNKVASELGWAIGALLHKLEISTNLAPVVDIKSKSKADFISNRSFGSDASLVSDVALSYSKGLLKGGTLPTLKHFPGLGGLTNDSHKTTLVKELRLEDALKKDWKPYIDFSAQNLPFFVMTSHTRLILDNEDYGVVTYSKLALKKLRSITSKDQVIVTDDLQMLGAQNGDSFEQSALESFLAGHDLIFIGWTGSQLKRTLQHFYSVRKQPLFQARLKESLERIYKLKQAKTNLTPEPFYMKNQLAFSSKLHSKITEHFLKQNRSPAQTKEQYLLFSSDRLFQKKIKKGAGFSLLQSPISQIKKKCLNQKCLLHLTGEQTARKILNILKKIKHKNFVVLNSSDPNYLAGANVPVIQVYTKSRELGNQVGAWL